MFCVFMLNFSSLYCWQLLNGLFVLRMAIKGLFELCQDESQFVHFLNGTQRYENLLLTTFQNIATLDESKIGIAYHLQLESVQVIIMMLSSPLFGRPSKIFDKLLNSATLTDLAPKLSQKLTENFIANNDAPLDIYEPGNERVGNGSLVVSLASGLWSILTFGYSNVAATAPSGNASLDEELWSKTPLSDLSALLLLLLINHSSSMSKSSESTVPEDHCYRMALYNCYSHKGNI